MEICYFETCFYGDLIQYFDEWLTSAAKLRNHCLTGGNFCGSPDSYFLYKNVTATKESFCCICIHHVATVWKRLIQYFLQRSTSFCGAVTCFCVQYFVVLFEGVHLCVLCFSPLRVLWRGYFWMCYSDYAARGGACHCFFLLCGHRWECCKQQTGATAQLQRDLFTAAACTLFSQ